MITHLSWMSCAVLLLCCIVPAAQAQQPAEIAAQAQGAYFTSDAAMLNKLAADTAAWTKATDNTLLYAHAYVQFRALQSAVGAGRNRDAQRAGDACNAALDAALKRDPKFAEGHALQSACYGYLANLGGMAAIRNGSRSGKSMESALALAPKNPRVMLIDGFGVYFRPKFVGGDPAKGCRRFREAAAAFDSSSPSTETNDLFGWGAAEAHYWSGRCAKDSGDQAMARREFERALQIAPNFAAANRALRN
jgi:Tfp pilus assembly protein PilF